MKWPVSWGSPRSKEPLVDKEGNPVDFIYAWKQMEKEYEAGKVKALGISNFSKWELEKLLEYAKHPPVLHQMELTPYLQQKEYVEFNKEQGITVASYVPVGGDNIDRGHAIREMFNEPVLTSIAEKYGLTVQQLIIAWHITRGEVVLPYIMKDADPIPYLKGDMTIETADVEAINELDRGIRFSIPKNMGDYHPFSDLEGNDSFMRDLMITPDPTVTRRYQLDRERAKKEAEKAAQEADQPMFGTRNYTGDVLGWVRSLEKKEAKKNPYKFKAAAPK
ncbi:hypothetical protein ABW20_dc0110036 [Dactylellina cionopaga]|nr:hypothetical protein ABW20_dc0110036 [Dactylellina cionopaga]